MDSQPMAVKHPAVVRGRVTGVSVRLVSANRPLEVCGSRGTKADTTGSGNAYRPAWFLLPTGGSQGMEPEYPSR